MAVGHEIALPAGEVTVHNIDPAGTGLPLVPETNVVRVVVPPRVGELDAVRLIVGTRVEMPRVTEFDVTAEKLTSPL